MTDHRTSVSVGPVVLDGMFSTGMPSAVRVFAPNLGNHPQWHSDGMVLETMMDRLAHPDPLSVGMNMLFADTRNVPSPPRSLAHGCTLIAKEDVIEV